LGVFSASDNTFSSSDDDEDECREEIFMLDIEAARLLLAESGSGISGEIALECQSWWTPTIGVAYPD